MADVSIDQQIAPLLKTSVTVYVDASFVRLSIFSRTLERARRPPRYQPPQPNPARHFIHHIPASRQPTPTPFPTTLTPDMAAALRPMMAVAREEAAIVASEASAAARTTVTTEATAAVRSAGHEALNPLAVREAAEASAKKTMDMGGELDEARSCCQPFQRVAAREGALTSASRRVNVLTSESRIFSAPSHAKTPGTPTLSTSTSTVANTALHEAGAEATNVTATASVETSVVGQMLEQEVGVTVKEAMTNGAETGAQEVAEQASEMLQGMMSGNTLDPQRRVNAAMRAQVQ